LREILRRRLDKGVDPGQSICTYLMLPRRRPLCEPEDTLSGRVTQYFRRSVDSFSDVLTHRVKKRVPALAAACAEANAVARRPHTAARIVDPFEVATKLEPAPAAVRATMPTPANPISLPKASPVLIPPAAPPRSPMLPRPVAIEPGAPVILTAPPAPVPPPKPARKWPLMIIVATGLVAAIVVSRTPASAHPAQPTQPHVFASVRVEREPAPALTRAVTNVVEFEDVVPVAPRAKKPRRAKIKTAKAKPAAAVDSIDDLAEAQLRASQR
jgi:hypothetical protein